MPTYEYACKSCGEHLEVVQSFKDEPLTKCPNCGGELRKVFGSIGIAFKGSGFYKTDSRSTRKGAKKEAAEKTSSEKSEKTSDKKSEKSSSDSGTSSKPDSKPGSGSSKAASA